MAIPDDRLSNKIQAAKFTAFGGLVISIEPHYCEISDDNIVGVELSPVVKLTISNRRVCEDVDVVINIDDSYSPFRNIASYNIDWGDGNSTGVQAWGGGPGDIAYGAAAGEWDLAGANRADFTMTITITDDAGAPGPYSASIEVQIEVINCSVFPFEGWAGFDDEGLFEASTWSTALPANFTGDWLNINDVNLQRHGEVWIATDAGIAYLLPGGEWTKLVLDDPPNSWGDTPAPTESSINYIRFLRHPSFTERAYVACQWQVGGEYRSCLLYTTDNFATWTWQSLGGSPAAVGEWAYPVACLEDEWCETYCDGDANCVCPDARRLSNCDNAFEDDGNVATIEIDWTARAANCTHMALKMIVFDMGAYIAIDPLVVDGAINCEAQVGTITDDLTLTEQVLLGHKMHYGLLWVSDPMTSEHLCELTTYPFLDFRDTFNYPPPANSTATDAEDTSGFMFRYIAWVMRYFQTLGEPTYFGTGTAHHELDYFKLWPSAVDSEIRILGMAIDEGGQYLYLTIHEAGHIWLKRFDIDTSLELPAMTRDLGVATHAQLDARTYWAVPYCPQVHGENTVAEVYVYGKIPDDPDVGATELTFSDDAGETVSDVADASWGAGEWVGAMVVDADDADLLYVCLNSGSPEFWKSEDGGATWTNVSNLPFSVEALDPHPDYYGEFIIGNRAAAANPIQYSMSYGASWTARSTGLPGAPTGGVRVVKLKSEAP
ncbi:hypothetical protein DRH14_03015 [Candidatus Shapirobacteria bacterium]|nr:MAG: hypothetical protein DRH14_03015 [Candidatus Shapirobacteria bacterium]